MTTPSTGESRVARTQRRLRDPDILNDPRGAGDKRQYIKITADMEGQVLAARHRLGIAATYEAIADEVALPARTVRYILTQMPHLRRAADGDTAVAASLKDRIYEAVKVAGPIDDVQELRAVLGMGDPEHDVVHVLHSLHTGGRIDFDERGNGRGTATYVNIRLPKRGPKPKRDDNELLPGPRVLSTVALDAPAGEPTPEPVAQDTAPVEAQPTPVEEEYPLLRALAEREWRRQDGDSKANAYLAAATAIEKIDPAMAADLMTKAEALADPYPSPLEAEYLRYATAQLPQNKP